VENCTDQEDMQGVPGQSRPDLHQNQAEARGRDAQYQGLENWILCRDSLEESKQEIGKGSCR
jgi:hypothetical protein